MIYIQEIGILSGAAQNKEELFQLIREIEYKKEYLKSGKEYSKDKKEYPESEKECKKGSDKYPECENKYPRGRLEFSTAVPASKLRRCSRYTKLAVNAAWQAVSGGAPKETGTVISTGYGAVESNIAFADSVVRGDPAMCSPTIFSSTVPNSCAGQICIVNGFCGEGTMLTGGDPLEYAELLIRCGKAEQILCGSVEEYSGELAKALGREGILRFGELSEGAVMLLVSGDSGKDAYCKVTEFSSASFSCYPYLYKISEADAEEVIKEVFAGISKRPDIVLLQANNTYLDEAEYHAASRFWRRYILLRTKRMFGETLGCGYLLNVAFGAAWLKERQPEVRSVLAAGLDTHGNYMTAFLEV